MYNFFYDGKQNLSKVRNKGITIYKTTTEAYFLYIFKKNKIVSYIDIRGLTVEGLKRIKIAIKMVSQ